MFQVTQRTHTARLWKRRCGLQPEPRQWNMAREVDACQVRAINGGKAGALQGSELLFLPRFARNCLESSRWVWPAHKTAYFARQETEPQTAEVGECFIARVWQPGDILGPTVPTRGCYQNWSFCWARSCRDPLRGRGKRVGRRFRSLGQGTWWAPGLRYTKLFHLRCQRLFGVHVWWLRPEKSSSPAPPTLPPPNSALA